MKVYKNLFDKIISPENLFLAWEQFKKGKTGKKDVAKFEWNLEQYIFKLHRDLKSKIYRHGRYYSFSISDPKPRNIHKSSVRDRVLHHAVFQVLYPLVESTFIYASFSCRKEFGTHCGVRYLRKVIRKATRNGRVRCYALKCDVKKFFDTVDHDILLAIFKHAIKDDEVIRLLDKIISSFQSDFVPDSHKCGVPIGNLTSQLFANVYMNEFDQFIKHELKVKYYLRYTDDFLIIAEDERYLENIIPKIVKFLGERLHLNIHKEKTFIKKVRQGADFLGYVVFKQHCLPRTKTKRRIFGKLQKRIMEYQAGAIPKEKLLQCLNSYLGFLSHANAFNLRQLFKAEVLNSLQ